MNSLMRVGLFVVALVGAMPAVARDYYYFYRPNADRDAYVADRAECDRLARGVRGPVYTSGVASSRETTVHVPYNGNLTMGQNAAASAIAGLFVGLMEGSATRRAVSAVERTCMADKGYARYGVDKAVVADIEKLQSLDDRVERYFALATAAQPIGKRIVE